MKKSTFLFALTLFFGLIASINYSIAQCGPGQSQLTLNIDFSGDFYPEEDGWRLVNITDGITVDSACFGTYATSTGIETIIICADTGKSYVLKAYDDFGDGLDGSSYALSYSFGPAIGTIGTNNFNIPDTLCGAAYTNNELADSTAAFLLQYVAPPACLAPTPNQAANISTNTADVSWIENGSATTYRVEWDTLGYAAGTARN